MATKPEYRDGNGFIAEVIRSSRKRTADIRVEDGAVSVVVPTELSIERIDSLLKTKRKWIKEKIALHREKTPVSDRQFVSGEAFSYLGRRSFTGFNTRRKPATSHDTQCLGSLV